VFCQTPGAKTWFFAGEFWWIAGEKAGKLTVIFRARKTRRSFWIHF
jgi:hypothetical protein